MTKSSKRSTMLGKREKQEMLADGRSAKRREAFRKIRVQSTLPDLDTYLRFLDGVVKSFAKMSRSPQKTSGSNFKL